MHRSCYIVFLSLIIDLIAFAVILPLMPSILDHYKHHDQSGSFKWCFNHISNLQQMLQAPSHLNNVLFGGLLGSWFCLLQFLCGPLLGAASDRIGRKPCLLLSYAGLALAYALWSVSGNSFALFLASRTLGGICKANISIAMAIMADLLPRNRRASGMALIGVAFALGFTLGPLFGAGFVKMAAGSSASGPDQHLLPARFSFGLSLFNVIFVIFCLEESLPHDKRASSTIHKLSEATDFINPIALFSFRQIKKASVEQLSKIRSLGAIFFIFMFFYSGLEFTLSFLTHLRFSYTSMQQGKMYLFCGVAMMLIQGGIIRRMKQGRETTLAIVGLFSVIPSFIMMGFANTSFQLYAALLLYSFASSSVVPCLTALISGLTSAQEQGIVLGTFRSLGAFARALGPLAASFVFWKYGPVICYMIGGLCLAIPVMMMRSLAPKLRFNHQKEE